MYDTAHGIVGDEKAFTCSTYTRWLPVILARMNEGFVAFNCFHDLCPRFWSALAFGEKKASSWLQVN